MVLVRHTRGTAAQKKEAASNDYCSCVWDPISSATLSNKLESVQRFAAKLCTKRWSDSPTLLMISLNWPTLRSRHSRQRAMLCRRIIRNESIIPSSPYFCHQPHRNPRTSHSHSVIVPHARTSASVSILFFCFRLSTLEQPPRGRGSITIISFF